MEITQLKSSWQHDITPLLGGPIFSLIKIHSYQAKIFLLYHIDAESEGMNPGWNYRNLGQVLINPTKVGPTLHRVRPASSRDYSWLGCQFKGEDHQMDGAAFLAHHQQSIHDKTRSIRVGPTRRSSDDFEILRTARGRKLLPHNYFLRYLLSLSRESMKEGNQIEIWEKHELVFMHRKIPQEIKGETGNPKGRI